MILVIGYRYNNCLQSDRQTATRIARRQGDCKGPIIGKLMMADNQNHDSKSTESESSQLMLYGAGFGVALGAGVGSAFGEVALGAGIGTALGAVAGTFLMMIRSGNDQ